MTTNFNQSNQNQNRLEMRDLLIRHWAILTTSSLRSEIFGIEKEIFGTLKKSVAETNYTADLKKWIGEKHRSMSALSSTRRVDYADLVLVRNMLLSEVDYYSELMQAHATLLSPEKRSRVFEEFEKTMIHGDFESLKHLNKTIAILDKKMPDIIYLKGWSELKKWKEEMAKNRFGFEASAKSFKNALAAAGAMEGGALRTDESMSLSSATKYIVGANLTRQQGFYAAYANAVAELYDSAAVHLLTIQKFHTNIAPLLRAIKPDNPEKRVFSNASNTFVVKMSQEIENLTNFISNEIIDMENNTAVRLKELGTGDILEDLLARAGGITDINRAKVVIEAALIDVEKPEAQDLLSEAFSEAIEMISKCYATWLVFSSSFNSYNDLVKFKELMGNGIGEVEYFFLKRMEINTRDTIALLKGKVSEAERTEISSWFERRNTVIFDYEYRNKFLEGILSPPSTLSIFDTPNLVAVEISLYLSMYMISLAAYSNAAAGWTASAATNLLELMNLDSRNAGFYKEERHIGEARMN
jgi:hypothetical protein